MGNVLSDILFMAKPGPSTSSVSRNRPAPAVNRTDGANKAPFEQMERTNSWSEQREQTDGANKAPTEQKERTNSWSEQREQTDGANKAPTLGGGDISWFSQWFPVVFA